MNRLPETQRLFFALWPGAEIREQATQIVRQMLGKRGKRVHSENLHLTLAFLGSTTKQQRACVEAVADTIESTAFVLRLEQIGYCSRPRVVWLAPWETPQPLIELVQQLNQGLRACGYQPEARPYRAHMTLARKVAGYFPVCEVAPLACPVEHFYLVRSVSYPGGVEYQVLRSWPLAQ